MTLKHAVLALAACAALAFMPSNTRADNLSLVLSPATYVGQSGGSVTLTGTFTNGAGAITWDGYQLNGSPAGLSDAAVQPIDYFSGGLASGAVFTGSIFKIDIDAGVANGTLFPLAANSLTIFYIDHNGNSSQVNVNFQIGIRNEQPPPGVPEPATMVLLGSGLAGIAALKRRRNSPKSS